MNIVFICRLFYPHIGGVEKHVLKLSETLIQNNHTVTVITEQYEKKLSEIDTYNNIKIFRIPVSTNSEKEKKITIWKWLYKNQQILNTADILHIHDVVFWLYPWKLLHPAKNIFTTFHGWEGIYPIPKKNILQRRFDAWLSTKNICVGDFIKKWYGIKPDVVTYGACDTKLKPIADPRNILLFLGRLSLDTGFEECLNRYRLLKPRLGWKLRIVGDGDLKNSVPSDAIYVGPQQDPQKELSQAKYVYASGYLSMLEAFIQKKIVLSSFNNPVKQDYVLLHPMAKYIYLEDKLPKVFYEEPYNWAKAQTWAKLALQYETLWSKSQ